MTSRPRAWVGVDLGTSSLKVLAVDEAGRTVAESETPYAVDVPAPGRAEADPATWVGAVTDALLALEAAHDLQGIGLAGQMHGTVLVDDAGTPLRPAVLWPDGRAAGRRDAWEAALSPAELGRVGGPWSAGMTGPVLAWLSEHEPEVVAAAAAVLLPKDHVRDRLVAGSGERSVVTDPSDAAGTLLWDSSTGGWLDDTDRLVPARLLPPLRASREVGGEWHGVPVTVGGGDTPVSLLALETAVGDVTPGDVVVNLGTGVQAIDPRPTSVDRDGWPSRHLYAGTGSGARSGADGDRYAMVAAQSGGLALTWAAERLGLGWDALLAAADCAPSGSDGVGFSPFVALERGALHSDRPAGWSGRHGDAPPVALAARSALEAQAFLVRRCLELLEPARVERVLVVGGGARDARVRQLLADVLGRPVHRLPVRSAAAVGAALLAGAPAPPAPALDTTGPRADAALAAAYDAWRGHCYP